MKKHSNSQTVRTTAQPTIFQPGDLVFDVGANVGDKTARFLARGARVVCVDNLTLDQAIQAYGQPQYIKIDVDGFERSNGLHPVLRGLSQSAPFLAFTFAVEWIEHARQCVRWLEGLGFADFNFTLGEETRFASPNWLKSKSLFELLQSRSDALKGDIYARGPAIADPVQLWLPGQQMEQPEDFLRTLMQRPITTQIHTVYGIGAPIFHEKALLESLFPNLEQIILFEPQPGLLADWQTRIQNDPRVRLFPYADLESAIAEFALPRPDMFFVDVQDLAFDLLTSLSSDLRRGLRLIYTEVNCDANHCSDESVSGMHALSDLRFSLAPEFVFLGCAPQASTRGKALFVQCDALADVYTPLITTLSRANRCLLREDFPATRQALQQALRLAPDDPWLGVTYANLLLRMADRKAAREQFAKVIAAHPTYAPARAGLDVVLWQEGQGQDAMQEQGVLQERSVLAKREALVDIVIPVCGQPDLLRRCVESILATTHSESADDFDGTDHRRSTDHRTVKGDPGPSAHLILVDVCTPGDAIRSLFDEWRGHERVTLASASAGQGLIAASKSGAQLGSAPYILFLSSEIVAADPSWLKNLLPQERRTAIVGARLLYPCDIPGPLAGMIQHAGVARNADGVPYHPFLGWPADAPEVKSPRQVNAVTGACLLVRRSVWDELGGWDERFGRGVYEDVDLCWRARRKGYEVLYQPEAWLYHYESASKAADGQHSLNAHTQENLKKLLAKWGHPDSDESLFFGPQAVKGWKYARQQIKQAQRWLDQGKTGAALDVMRAAIVKAPDLPEALIGFAQLLSQQGDHTQAVEYYRRALQRVPANWEARLALVDNCITIGQVQEAAFELEQLQAVFSNHPRIQQRLEMLALFQPQYKSP